MAGLPYVPDVSLQGAREGSSVTWPGSESATSSCPPCLVGTQSGKRELWTRFCLQVAPGPSPHLRSAQPPPALSVAAAPLSTERHRIGQAERVPWEWHRRCREGTAV